MPIDAMNGRSSLCSANVEPAGMLRPISCSRASFGFSSKATMSPSRSKRKMPICVAVSASTGCAAMVMSALLLTMRVDELVVVHPVEMIAGEDRSYLASCCDEVPGRLADGVGGALIPVRVVRRLLGGEDLDEAAGEAVQPVGVGDVPVERRRVELRQHEDAADVRVQAAADRECRSAGTCRRSARLAWTGWRSAETAASLGRPRE